jgi:PAS domain S-box-containing protein
MEMTGYYDPWMIVLSVLIAVTASYAALDLAGRVSEAHGWPRAAWLSAGAMAMGLGIWSMHYIGMLAFHLPAVILYHLPTVILSLAAAILASAVALWVSSGKTMGPVQAIPASLVMGAGIATMHYSGMAAMRLPASMSFDPVMVTVSVMIAVIVSLVALWRAFRLRVDTGCRWHRDKLVSAMAMGAAIPLMHYTGMAAVEFKYSSRVVDVTGAVSISTLSVTAIIVSTMLVLGGVMVSAIVNRKFIAKDAALAASDIRFRALVEQSGDALVLLDAAGTITFASGAIYTLLGFRPEEIVGRSVIEFIDPADADEAKGDLMHLHDDAEAVVHRRGRYRRKDGSWRIGEGTLCNRLHHPAVRSLVLNFRDATERVHLEEQLRVGQKMEAIGRLAGGVAHDFNNMLTAISGYADLLFEGADIADPRTQDIREIQNAAARAAELTRQLLAFSRKQVLQPKVINLNTIVAEVEHLLERLIGEDVLLRTALALDLGNCEADPAQVEQVLMNLVMNSRAAIPECGTIGIETGNVTVTEATVDARSAIGAGEYVRLVVRDSGKGIDEETCRHIFDPFFTTKARGESTGLGLAMVYGIVQQSAGHIWVESVPGEGTTFTILLPRVQAGGVTGEHVVARVAPRGREKVLLAEDEESVQRLARKVLERQGYEVLSASNGVEALAIAANHPAVIDLLVTDVIMPRMGGRALADHLTLTRPGTKVLFVSGYSDDAISRHGILEPGFAFLEKPFTADGLARKIREVLDGTPRAATELPMRVP